MSVDLLEPVQVDQQQTRFRSVPCVGGQRLAEPVGQQGAIGQPGQRVVQRLVHREFPLDGQQSAVAPGHPGQRGCQHQPEDEHHGGQGLRDGLQLLQGRQLRERLLVPAPGRGEHRLLHGTESRVHLVVVDLQCGDGVLAVGRPEQSVDRPQVTLVADEDLLDERPVIGAPVAPDVAQRGDELRGRLGIHRLHLGTGLQAVLALQRFLGTHGGRGVRVVIGQGAGHYRPVGRRAGGLGGPDGEHAHPEQHRHQGHGRPPAPPRLMRLGIDAGGRGRPPVGSGVPHRGPRYHIRWRNWCPAPLS